MATAEYRSPPVHSTNSNRSLGLAVRVAHRDGGMAGQGGHGSDVPQEDSDLSSTLSQAPAELFTTREASRYGRHAGAHKIAKLRLPSIEPECGSAGLLRAV